MEAVVREGESHARMLHNEEGGINSIVTNGYIKGWGNTNVLLGSRQIALACSTM